MKEVTILIPDGDYEAMMRHHAAARLGMPLVAVHMVVAVEGNQDYNLNEFEARDEEAAAKKVSPRFLTTVLPNGVRVLAKAPGVAYHYANLSQAEAKLSELKIQGVNAFVIGHGKPAKYIRVFLAGENE